MSDVKKFDWFVPCYLRALAVAEYWRKRNNALGRKPRRRVKRGTK